MILIYLVFMIFSTTLNAFLIWYAYNLLRDRIALVELFKQFSPLVKKYEEHLQSLTKMEIYFGEPTIMALVEHTKEIGAALDDVLQSIEVEERDDDTEEK